MIAVDSSAVVAIFRDEPEADRLSHALTLADRRLISAATYVERALVLSSRIEGRADLDQWLAHRSIDVAPVDHALARLAADAFARFGKGRHPAGLNFGDCFASTLAQSLNASLLFKGQDFTRTDVVPARP